MIETLFRRDSGYKKWRVILGLSKKGQRIGSNKKDHGPWTMDDVPPPIGKVIIIIMIIIVISSLLDVI